ncbi:hypothetical protein CAEBREN_20980 [Caenorhabditis brenneri]|uniref:Uncharacterized protein n=1 Tax=Caenorhabditis brenneri TaxID=135651 RepID=G0MIC5_CAEBE|nr:hypothetical protein CAEBREN_20980 [Caenorhabditis brenneri]
MIARLVGGATYHLKRLTLLSCSTKIMIFKDICLL